MFPEFDKNAAYIWAITAAGIISPILLAVYAHIRATRARKRLERLQKAD